MQNNSRYQEWCDCLQKTRLGLDPFDSKLSAPRCTTRWESEAKVELRGWEGMKLQCWMLIELENIGCCFERWAFEIRKGVILESSGTLKLWSTPLFKFSYQDIGFAACIEVHSRDALVTCLLYILRCMIMHWTFNIDRLLMLVHF